MIIICFFMYHMLMSNVGLLKTWVGFCSALTDGKALFFHPKGWTRGIWRVDGVLHSIHLPFISSHFSGGITFQVSSFQ